MDRGTEVLEATRAAFRRRDWVGARDAFRAAREAGQALSADDAYGTAVYWNTLELYQLFLELHPGDARAQLVQDMLAQRREAIAWAWAVRLDEAQSYQSFLSRFPASAHAAEARRLAEAASNRALAADAASPAAQIAQAAAPDAPQPAAAAPEAAPALPQSAPSGTAQPQPAGVMSIARSDQGHAYPHGHHAPGYSYDYGQGLGGYQRYRHHGSSYYGRGYGYAYRHYYSPGYYGRGGYRGHRRGYGH